MTACAAGSMRRGAEAIFAGFNPESPPRLGCAQTTSTAATGTSGGRPGAMDGFRPRRTGNALVLSRSLDGGLPNLSCSSSQQLEEVVQLRKVQASLAMPKPLGWPAAGRRAGCLTARMPDSSPRRRTPGDREHGNRKGLLPATACQCSMNCLLQICAGNESRFVPLPGRLPIGGSRPGDVTRLSSLTPEISGPKTPQPKQLPLVYTVKNWCRSTSWQYTGGPDRPGHQTVSPPSPSRNGFRQPLAPSFLPSRL